MPSQTLAFLPAFPAYSVMLAFEPEELAPHVLLLARGLLQNGRFHGDSLLHAIVHPPHQHQDQGPAAGQRDAIELALVEALQWLLLHLLVVPDAGVDGTNGHMRIARRGQRLLDDPESFAAFRRGVAFPKELLHPSIADSVWLRLVRGEFDDAVFVAFRAMEGAVHDASGLPANWHGDKLLRAAFHPTDGPLTDFEAEEGERHALSNLFAGAYGTHRNPVAHRNTFMSAEDAQTMVMFASYLLRVVDDRKMRATRARA